MALLVLLLWARLVAVTKLSISLSPAVAERARRAAAAAGLPLSAWLSRAAEEAAELAEARAALAEHVERCGEPDPDVVVAVGEDLAAAGFGRYETPADRAAREEALSRLRGESSRDERKAG